MLRYEVDAFARDLAAAGGTQHNHSLTSFPTRRNGGWHQILVGSHFLSRAVLDTRQLRPPSRLTRGSSGVDGEEYRGRRGCGVWRHPNVSRVKAVSDIPVGVGLLLIARRTQIAMTVSSLVPHW